MATINVIDWDKVKKADIQLAVYEAFLPDPSAVPDPQPIKDMADLLGEKLYNTLDSAKTQIDDGN